MKNLILLVGVALMTISCTKNSEQINIVKDKLSQLPLYKKEVKDMSFECFDVLDSDVYKYNFERFTKFGSRSDAQRIIKYQDSLEKSTGKKFYKVHFFRLVGKDTLNNGYIYLNDENKQIGFKFEK